MANDTEVLVIGGGVVGVCCAYYLCKSGRRVTVVEKGDICSGSSYGNAGLISSSHAIPLPAPGVMRKALKWMLDVESPFYMRPRLDLGFAAWLWRFANACREKRMRETLPILRELNRAGKQLHDEIAATHNLPCGYEQKGLLEVYTTARGYEEGMKSAELLREFEIEARVLDADGVRQLDSGVLSSVMGGVYFPEDAHLDPAAFVRQLARVVAESGVEFRTNTEVLGFKTSGTCVRAVESTRGELRSEHIVLAAGSWCAPLGRELGIRLPIEAAKGYGITFRRPAVVPTVPLLLAEAKVAVTPLGESLRYAGTLELAGLDLGVDRRRVEAIIRAVRNYHRCSEACELVEIWRGLRPCTPDGLPAIGRSAMYDNLLIATGHAMKGMCQGTITGKLVAQLVCNETPTVDVGPFRPDRF